MKDKEKLTDTELVLDQLVTAVETAGEMLVACQEREIVAAQIIAAMASAAEAYTNLTREASFQKKHGSAGKN